jgi:hypothetical protein
MSSRAYLDRNFKSTHTFVAIAALLCVTVGVAGCGNDTADAAEADLADCAVGQVQRAPLLHSVPLADDQLRQVGALVATQASGIGGGLCTATLIAPDVALTAGHCVAFGSYKEHAKRKPRAMRMTFSQKARAFPVGLSKPIHVAHAVVHPDYEHERYLLPPLLDRWPMDEAEQQLLRLVETQCGKRNDPFGQQAFWRCVMQLPDDFLRQLGYADSSMRMADIALVFLERPIWDTEPVGLPSAPLQVDESRPLLSVGYGISTYGSWYGHGIGARRAGPSYIAGLGQYEMHIDHKTVRICSGDSGGPLLRQMDDGSLETVGVASRGGQDWLGHCVAPSLLTRVDAYVPWIRAQMQAACDVGWRDPAACSAWR